VNNYDGTDDDLAELALAAHRRAVAGESTQPFVISPSCDPDVAVLNSNSPDAVGVIAENALANARFLADAVRYGSLTDRRVAHQAISQLHHVLSNPYRGRVAPQPRSFRLGIALEERFLTLRARWVQLDWRPSAQRWWTVIGFFASVIIAALVGAGYFFAAACLLGVRMLVSSTMPTPGFPGDAGARGQPWVNWRACVVGQLSDASAMAGVPIYLFLHDAAVLGLFTLAVPIMMMGATMLRLAAAQGGVVLGRLYVERIARNGVLLLGLSMTAVASLIFGETSAVLVVAGVTGAASYAAVEAARTLVYARERGVADRASGVHEAFARRTANAIAVIDNDIEAELSDIDAA